MQNRNDIADLILRIGVAFAFIYAAIAGFVDPDSWIGWFPQTLRNIIPDLLLLKLWGAYEIILALWILSGKKIFIPSALATLSLAGLIVTNFGAMDIIFRDVTILCATLALAIKTAPSTILDIKIEK